MERAGVNDERLAKVINDGLDATITKTATMDGQITDTLELINYSERREMAELCCKLKGHYVDRHEHGVSRTLEEILEASYQLEEAGER
jgi:hypothetical protein